jgi:hypothetical protein
MYTSEFALRIDRLDIGLDTEADKLGRSDKVKTWAETTTVILSYVVDAADFVIAALFIAALGLIFAGVI